MATQQQTTSLTAELRDAFAALAHTDLDEEVRARLHRRLIAITDTARDDARHAAARLERWRAELDAATR